MNPDLTALQPEDELTIEEYARDLVEIYGPATPQPEGAGDES